MCAIGVYFVLADAIVKMADVIAMRGLLADVIAMWLVLLPLLFVCLGRCYSLEADGIAIGSMFLVAILVFVQDLIPYVWQMVFAYVSI